MHWPRIRLTIWQTMLVVASAAGLLAASRSPIGLCVAFGLVYLALVGVLWSMFHGFRRFSALCFGLMAALSNMATAGLGIYRFSTDSVFLMFLVWLLAFPLVLGAGIAWVTTATRREVRSRRSPIWAWPLVIASGILPLTMVVTLWPLRLAFLASTPALDSLAGRVSAGQGVTSPEWAGLFRVVYSAVEPSNGNVGLIIDPERSGRSGFVRVGTSPALPSGSAGGPFYNLNLDMRLSDTWRYVCED
jgi:hypothetical protein